MPGDCCSACLPPHPDLQTLWPLGFLPASHAVIHPRPALQLECSPLLLLLVLLPLTYLSGLSFLQEAMLEGSDPEASPAHLCPLTEMFLVFCPEQQLIHLSRGGYSGEPWDEPAPLSVQSSLCVRWKTHALCRAQQCRAPLHQEKAQLDRP